MAAYLYVATEDGGLSVIMATLREMAGARRMSATAQEIGVDGESPCKAFSTDSSLKYETVLKVVYSVWGQALSTCRTRVRAADSRSRQG